MFFFVTASWNSFSRVNGSTKVFTRLCSIHPGLASLAFAEFISLPCLISATCYP